jgi:hypothetical protein
MMVSVPVGQTALAPVKTLSIGAVYDDKYPFVTTVLLGSVEEVSFLIVILPLTSNLLKGLLVPIPTFPLTAEYWSFPLEFQVLEQFTEPSSAIAETYEPTVQLPVTRACLVSA